jgi:hypothetical protein
MGGECGTYKRTEIHNGFCGKRDHLYDLSVDGRILKLIVNKQNKKEWTTFIWLRTGKNDRILLTWS